MSAIPVDKVLLQELIN